MTDESEPQYRHGYRLTSYWLLGKWKVACTHKGQVRRITEHEDRETAVRMALEWCDAKKEGDNG